MFKNLRKRLKSFEEDLESALEDELEKQLEKELADAIGEKEPAEEATPEERPGSPAPKTAPERQSAAPEAPSEDPAAPGETQRPSSKPEGDATQEPPAPKASPDSSRDERPGPAPRPDTDRAPVSGSGPAPGTRPAEKDAKPEPARETATPPDRPEKRAPKPEEPVAPPAQEDVEPAAPKKVPVPTAAVPVKRERVRKPGGPVKKTDAEIAAEVEASIAAELGDAVEAQKEIETTIRDTAGEAVVRLSDERLDDLLWELEVALMESDVALPVVEAIKNNVRDQLREARIPKRGAGETVQRVLMTAVRRVLNEPFDFDAFVKKADKPVVIMFVGVNGTGKTTSIAKIAHRLKGQGLGVVLAAGDTFRAGAVQQLEQHAERLGVKLVKHEGKNADPAAVAFDAIDHAKSRHKDVVLLDTAGRQQTNTNLMNEMEKIKRVAQPDLILFVGDSLAGNDAVTQADKFNDVVGIDGVILTKVDADAKGGAALSVAYAIGKPLVFIGLGQEYEDQVPFDRDWMLNRLFGEDELEAAAA